MHVTGNSDNAAYLANVCVADTARRQGVGGALIQAARQVAKTWGEPFCDPALFPDPIIPVLGCLLAALQYLPNYHIDLTSLSVS